MPDCSAFSGNRLLFALKMLMREKEIAGQVRCRIVLRGPLYYVAHERAVIVGKQQRNLAHGNWNRNVQRHGGEHVVDRVEILRRHLRDIAGLHRRQVLAELPLDLICQKPSARHTGSAHHQHAFFVLLGLLALEREGKGHGDIAQFVLGGVVAVRIGKLRRCLARHGIGQRKTALDVVEQRVLKMHVIGESNGKRGEMAGEIHTKLNVIAEVEPVRVPHHVNHAPCKLPHVVRNDLALLVVVEYAYTSKVYGDIANLTRRELHAGRFAHAASNKLGNLVLARIRRHIRQRVCRHIVAALNAQDRNSDMNKQILVRKGVDRKVLVRENSVHA